MSGLNRKDDAERNAKALIMKLKGKGWKPQVWENIGWHYKVVFGPIQVYPSSMGDDRYWCMIGDAPKGNVGGAGFWTPQSCRYFKDPNRAVRDAMGHVYAFVDRIAETVAVAEKVIGPRKRQ